MKRQRSAANGNRGARRTRMRFGFGALLLAMYLFCILGAAMYYGGRAIAAGMPFEPVLVIVVLSAPAVLLLSVKAGHALLLWINRRDA